METPESINKENIPSQSEQHGALPEWSIEDIRNLTSLEGKKSFLLSDDQDRAKDWYQRYRQVLLTDTDALLACKNLVKKAQNSEVTDQAHLFVDNDYLQMLLLVEGMIEPQFGEGDILALKQKNTAAVELISRTILEMSGLGQGGIEAAEERFQSRS